MKDLKFQLQEYCCIKQESAALPSKTYSDGITELTFSGPLDNEYDEFIISFATNQTTYVTKCISDDRKTWEITPALQEQINNTTVINKYIPIKAVLPGDIPSLSQVKSIINSSIFDSIDTNAIIKSYIYKTTYRKKIEFVIPESRYLVGFKMYAKETTDSEEYYEIQPQLIFDKLDIGQNVKINIAVQLYEMLFIFTTANKITTIQPKS